MVIDESEITINGNAAVKSTSTDTTTHKERFEPHFTIISFLVRENLWISQNRPTFASDNIYFWFVPGSKETTLGLVSVPRRAWHKTTAYYTCHHFRSKFSPAKLTASRRNLTKFEIEDIYFAWNVHHKTNKVDSCGGKCKMKPNFFKLFSIY